ncbi:hypothetical protein D3C74_360860 [compost metagenome]
MKQVTVCGVWFSRRCSYRNAMLLSIRDHLGTSRELVAEFFQTPRCNDVNVWCQRGRVQLKANLVIPFTRSAVSDGCSPFCTSDIHHAFSDQWTSDTCAEQVLSFIKGTCLEHWIDEIFREFIAQIVDVYFGSASSECFFLQAIQFVLLSDIRCEGDNLSIICFFQPFQNYRCV